MSAPFQRHESDDTTPAPSTLAQDYDAFVAAKRVATVARGFEPPLPVSSILFPFQADIVRWACRLGCAALFESFGLGKSLQQLELGRQVCAHTGGRFLIVCPLGVRQEFARDAALFRKLVDDEIDCFKIEHNFFIIQSSKKRGPRCADPREGN